MINTNEDLREIDSKLFRNISSTFVFKAVDKRVTVQDYFNQIKDIPGTGSIGGSFGPLDIEKENGFLKIKRKVYECKANADIYRAMCSYDTPFYPTKETYIVPNKQKINRIKQISFNRFYDEYKHTENSELPSTETESLKELKDYLHERDLVNLFEIQEEFDWARGDPSERLRASNFANLYGFSKDFRWNFFRLFDELGIAYEQFRLKQGGQTFIIGKPDVDPEDADRAVDYQREKVTADHMHIGPKFREYDEDHPLYSEGRK